MGDGKSMESNFEILDKKEYINCIKIKNGRYSIGRKALNSSLYFNGLIKDELLINLGKDNVDDNSRNGFLTLRNINSILCLFFYKDSKIEHKIGHVKRFLNNLKYHGKKMEDKIAFDSFITLVRPHLDSNFNQYNYTLNPKTWKFEITNIDSLPRNNKKIAINKKRNQLKIREFQPEKNSVIRKNKGSLISHFIKKKKTIWSILIVAGFIFGLKTYFENNTNEMSFLDTQRCVFSPDSTKQQILILPFKDIDGDKWKNDKGFILSSRLKELNSKDSLGFDVRFCHELLPEQYSEDYYDKLRKQYNANHIIYGFIDCESDLSNNSICLNYITDFQIPESLGKSSFIDTSIFEHVSNDELRKGSLQEDLDFLVYYNAMIGAYSQRKFEKAIKYSESLLKIDIQKNGIIHLFRAFIYFDLYKDDLALIEALKSLKYDFNQKSYAHNIIGVLFAYYSKNKHAKFHFEKSFNLNPNASNYSYLYVVNDKLNLHQDNITLMNVVANSNLKIHYPMNKYSLLYWGAESKKKLGKIVEFKKDSVLVKNYFLNNKDESLQLPLFGAMHLKVAAGHRIKVIESIERLKDGKFALKNMDSLYMDICRLKILSPESYKKNIPIYEKVKELNYGKELRILDFNSCNLSWEKIFSFDDFDRDLSN